ncbi:hypothetical protein [Paracoccus sphaerophysae]|uniref:hypothetical protein n=1 Tax=Paracoccus sphaerophysae TaxID=690417 RepID=UPI002356DCDB|nr:hypothetical protein [Paracoccus sphaerophysae]
MQLPLHRDQFTETGRVVLASDAFTATAFRYPTGVEALRIDTPRGHVEVLPFMGQMLWDAAFDGLRLTMKSQFDMPRPAPTIIGTYGCLAFHSGLLRNGVPSAADSHPVHGEFPTAPMDEAGLEIDGDTLRVTGRRDHIEGFGPHNRATPSVTLQAGQTLFDLGRRLRAQLSPGRVSETGALDLRERGYRGGGLRAALDLRTRGVSGRKVQG